jgi:DNA replication protein DnaC
MEMETESQNKPLDQDNDTPKTPTEAVSDQDLGDIVYQAYQDQHNGYEGSLSRGKSVEQLTGELGESVQRRLRRQGLGEVSLERIGQMVTKVERFIERERARRNQEAFGKHVGPRYADCSFATFEATLPAQKMAAEAVKAYTAKIGEQLAKGSGLLLFGPAGSGKDHLLCAAAREVIDHGHWVRWVNGRDMFGKFRDRMDEGDNSEGRLVAELIAAEILAISDPLPPSGTLSPYQADLLFRVIDGRYRAMRPTWATLNVTGGPEADQRMGAQIVDRLRHDAVAVHCDWPSHRKAQA